MYLKLLLQLIIPFSFNFAHCFKDRIYLEERYIEIRNNAQTIHELNASMCMDIELKKKLQVCQRIFKLLRDDTAKENPYRHSLYMNYEAFNLSLINPEYPVCQEKNVWIYLNLSEKYMSLNCYGQPPITSEISEKNQHLNEISIFNGTNGELVVLKCFQSNDKCVLLEWYNYDEWHKFSDIPDEVLIVPIPRTADVQKLISAFTDNLRSIRKMNYRKLNLINKKKRKLSADEFQKLCQLLLERSEYIDKCKTRELEKSAQSLPRSRKTNLTIFEPFVTIQQLETSKENLSAKTLKLPVFTCTKYKRKGSTEKNFKIMAGPDESSVILIEPTSYKNEVHQVPVELIENLHWDYVLHIEDWF